VQEELAQFMGFGVTDHAACELEAVEPSLRKADHTMREEVTLAMTERDERISRFSWKVSYDH
jgi:hypothetical protein